MIRALELNMAIVNRFNFQSKNFYVETRKKLMERYEKYSHVNGDCVEK